MLMTLTNFVAKLAAATTEAGVVSGAIPQPTPSAPASVTSAVNKALGVLMYLSIAALIAAVIGLGFSTWASEHRGQSGRSQALKETLPTVAISAALIGGAAAFVNYFVLG